MGKEASKERTTLKVVTAAPVDAETRVQGSAAVQPRPIGGDHGDVVTGIFRRGRRVYSRV